MKINDKSLALYASSRESISKDGYLEKKGEINHGYKRRWFILKGNLLFYFEKKTEKQPIGVIILENCSVEVSDGDKFSFCIRYQAFGTTGASRTYILCADSETEMEQWIKSITSASYCYAEMLVKEYEKRLAIEKIKAQDTNKNSFQETKKQTLLNMTSVTQDIKNKDSIDSSSVTKTVSSVKSESKFHTLSTAMLKPSNAMYTVQTTIHAKTKFKTLNGMRRTKSSENLNRIMPSKSPKSKRKTLKSGNNYALDNITAIAYETEKSTFETLHTSFGAAVWTKIGNTL